MSFSQTERVEEYSGLGGHGDLGVYCSINLFFFIIFYELASIQMFFLVGVGVPDKPLAASQSTKTAPP